MHNNSDVADNLNVVADVSFDGVHTPRVGTRYRYRHPSISVVPQYPIYYDTPASLSSVL